MSWQSWSVAIAELKKAEQLSAQQEAIISRVVMRLANARLARSLIKWRLTANQVAWERTQAKVLAKAETLARLSRETLTSLHLRRVVRGLVNSSLQKGWKSWREWVKIRTLTTLKLGAAKKALARASTYTLSKAWNKWAEVAKQLKEEKRKMARVVGHILRLRQAMSWQSWIEGIEQLRDVERTETMILMMTVRPIMFRLLNLRLTKALKRWRYAISQPVLVDFINSGAVNVNDRFGKFFLQDLANHFGCEKDELIMDGLNDSFLERLEEDVKLVTKRSRLATLLEYQVKSLRMQNNWNDAELILNGDYDEIASIPEKKLMLFKSIDIDGNGKLDLSEFVAAADILGLTPKEAKDYFKNLDRDGDGHLDIKEFLDEQSKKKKEMFQTDFINDVARKLGCDPSEVVVDSVEDHEPAAKLYAQGEIHLDADFDETVSVSKEQEKQFRALDKDGNGFLDLEEVRAGADSLGITKEEAEKFFKMLDVDGDKKVTMIEFIKGVKAQKRIIFQERFTNDLAKKLGCNPKDILIDKLEPGSVKVKFRIADKEAGGMLDELKISHKDSFFAGLHSKEFKDTTDSKVKAQLLELQSVAKHKKGRKNGFVDLLKRKRNLGSQGFWRSADGWVLTFGICFALLGLAVIWHLACVVANFMTRRHEIVEGTLKSVPARLA
eukprot:CAMPEP_0172646860 /NCGR_PEP_ID=MMETSP1068-20121228/240454_1 /TAXON_ID=35684 /ORGANISM="Pseudopedinella elastica, Strain CCMP716" /LENGTH=666 /DNA_ID=CAMNT_0013461125 /DNA_START=482 /DNA_END=2482 /DNA_ORIENTATION=-